MGKTKTVFVNCRMTEEEAAKLDLQMRLEGYRNRSYYWKGTGTVPITYVTACLESASFTGAISRGPMLT